VVAEDEADGPHAGIVFGEFAQRELGAGGSGDLVALNERMLLIAPGKRLKHHVAGQRQAAGEHDQAGIDDRPDHAEPASGKFSITTDRKLAIYAIVITGIWQSSGFAMALFLAGLRSVDQDIIKAARIDGAGTFRIYRKVILPTIAPIFLAVAVVLLQFAIKTFDLAVALTNGGPGIATTFPAIYVYDLMFQRGEIAEGAAAAIMMLLALAVVLVPYSLYIVWRRRRETSNG
jgi:ABC-type sugar transport system permease subunit